MPDSDDHMFFLWHILRLLLRAGWIHPFSVNSPSYLVTIEQYYASSKLQVLYSSCQIECINFKFNCPKRNCSRTFWTCPVHADDPDGLPAKRNERDPPEQKDRAPSAAPPLVNFFHQETDAAMNLAGKVVVVDMEQNTVFPWWGIRIGVIPTVMVIVSFKTGGQIGLYCHRWVEGLCNQLANARSCQCVNVFSNYSTKKKWGHSSSTGGRLSTSRSASIKITWTNSIIKY